MKWRGRQGSSNVNDRRGQSGGGGMPNFGGFKMGTGGMILLLVLYLVFGRGLIGGPSSPGAGIQNGQGTPITSEREEEYKQFISVVLKDTEDVWHEIFEENGLEYEEPQLNLFTGSINSGCGFASEQMGPFYCSVDKDIYIDLSFFDQLKNEFGAKGDFAMAYVLAHEVGHHVQKQIGILDKVHSLQGKVSEKEYNQYSVRLELQADYFAGVFAKHIQDRDILEEGDFEEAINAASKIGDDTLQEKYQGRVVPDSFTHGTSEQRMEWFKKGFEKGTIQDGDTFSSDI